MKPKSALFISATLTVFVLVILGSVVSTMNTTPKNDVAAVASATQEVLATEIPTQVDPTATAAAAPVSAEQAASIAAQYLNKTDVYSVESTLQNGVNVFKVVFSSGDVVYVGLDGIVISTEVLQPTTVYVEPTLAPKKKHNSNNNGNSGGTGGGNNGGEHEPETEHEEE